MHEKIVTNQRLTLTLIITESLNRKKEENKGSSMI